MAEPRGADTDEEAAAPRWVYVVGGLMILLALVFVVLHLSSGVIRH